MTDLSTVDSALGSDTEMHQMLAESARRWAERACTPEQRARLLPGIVSGLPGVTLLLALLGSHVFP